MIEPELVAVEVMMELSGNCRMSNVECRMSVAEIREQRWSKHPKEPSAGSFFRNPETGDGGRVPAGKLIEQCGLKGKTIGGAKVSEKHANFLVNTGRARFADVYELVQVIRATVEEQTGILLEEEVQYLPGPNEGRSRNQGVRDQGSGFKGRSPIPEPRSPTPDDRR
jgi:UDP-N-acetylenolpyruvoylglucosamine reductase